MTAVIKKLIKLPSFRRACPPRLLPKNMELTLLRDCPDDFDSLSDAVWATWISLSDSEKSSLSLWASLRDSLWEALRKEDGDLGEHAPRGDK